MAQVPPIDDAYIDDVIKSAGAYDPTLNLTQGVRLRELFKLFRDRMEQGTGGGIGSLQEVTDIGYKTSHPINVFTGFASSNHDLDSKGLSFGVDSGDDGGTGSIIYRFGNTGDNDDYGMTRLDFENSAGDGVFIFRPTGEEEALRVISKYNTYPSNEFYNGGGLSAIFNGRVIGVPATHPNEFVTLSQLGGLSGDLQTTTTNGHTTDAGIVINGNYAVDNTEQGLNITNYGGDGNRTSILQTNYTDGPAYNNSVVLNASMYSVSNFILNNNQVFSVQDPSSPSNGIAGVAGVFNGRVSGTPAANPNEFVTLGQLSSAGSAQPLIPVIYDELVALITGGHLVAGQQYVLTDFQSTFVYSLYTVDNDNNARLDKTSEEYSGEIEPLILLATATDKLSAIARSVIYPNDEITYTYQNKNGGMLSSTKGTIMSREDKVMLAYANFDWRTIKYKYTDNETGQQIIENAVTFSTNIWGISNSKVFAFGTYNVISPIVVRSILDSEVRSAPYKPVALGTVSGSKIISCEIINRQFNVKDSVLIRSVGYTEDHEISINGLEAKFTADSSVLFKEDIERLEYTDIGGYLNVKILEGPATDLSRTKLYKQYMDVNGVFQTLPLQDEV